MRATAADRNLRAVPLAECSAGGPTGRYPEDGVGYRVSKFICFEVTVLSSFNFVSSSSMYVCMYVEF